MKANLYLCLLMCALICGCTEHKPLDNFVAIYCTPIEDGIFALELRNTEGEWTAVYPGATPADKPIHLKYIRSDKYKPAEGAYIHTLQEAGSASGLYYIKAEGDDALSVVYIDGDKEVNFNVSASITDPNINTADIAAAEKAALNDGALTQTHLPPKGIATLLHVMHSNPATIKYTFDALQQDDRWSVASSADGRVRLYKGGYDTGMNGEAGFADMIICQYTTADGQVMTIDDFDTAYIFGDLDLEYFTKTNFPRFTDVDIYDATFDDERYYLVTLGRTDSYPMPYSDDNPVDVTEVALVIAFEIDGGRLKPAEIFNGKHFIEVPFKYDQYQPISYDATTGSLSIPLVDKALQHTGKYLVYKWDGTQFKYADTK